MDQNAQKIAYMFLVCAILGSGAGGATERKDCPRKRQKKLNTEITIQSTARPAKNTYDNEK